MKTHRYIYLAGSAVLFLMFFCPPVSAGERVIVGTVQAVQELIVDKCRIYSFYIMVWSTGAGAVVSLLGLAVAFLNRNSGIWLIKTGAVMAISGAAAYLLLSNAQDVTSVILQAVHFVLSI